jgi:hypothetical protein
MYFAKFSKEILREVLSKPYKKSEDEASKQNDGVRI